MDDSNLKAALGYKKFAGTPRVLILDTGYMVVNDVIDGASKLGWHCVKLETSGKGIAKGNFVGELLKTILVHKPDFLLTINHLGFDESGALAGLLDNFEIPVASWFVDHPLPVLGGAKKNATSTTQIFCFERTALRWLSDQGYQDPAYLPTGSNGRIFHPDLVDLKLSEQLSCKLSFVGNSWWTKCRLEPEQWIRKSALKFANKTNLNKQLVATDLGKKLDEITFQNKHPRAKYMVAQVALAEASMQTRKQFAAALSPLGLRVFGDPHWHKLVPDLDLASVLDYRTALPALFASGGINTNVTAEQMPTSLNQRVWDVPASGGFLLTDAQDDAFEFFEEGADIAVYRNFEEAADKARFYLEHPQTLKQIAQAAFEKVDREHRITNRLETMHQVMVKRWKTSIS